VGPLFLFLSFLFFGVVVGNSLGFWGDFSSTSGFGGAAYSSAFVLLWQAEAGD
jgi:hypothetical protein